MDHMATQSSNTPIGNVRPSSSIVSVSEEVRTPAWDGKVVNSSLHSLGKHPY